MGMYLCRIIYHSTAYDAGEDMTSSLLYLSTWKEAWLQPTLAKGTESSQFFLKMDLKSWQWFPHHSSWCQSYRQLAKHVTKPVWGWSDYRAYMGQISIKDQSLALSSLHNHEETPVRKQPMSLWLLWSTPFCSFFGQCSQYVARVWNTISFMFFPKEKKGPWIHTALPTSVH